MEQLQLFEELLQGNDAIDVPTEEPMDIFSKFAMVEMNADQRISSEELDFCQFNEKVYVETQAALKQALNLFTTLHETYKNSGDDAYDGANFLNFYSDINIYSEKIRKVYERFVSRITYYFAKRHNVTLSSDAITTKYNEDTITYQIILDEIFEQLGGFTFKEKAVAEIKANSKNTLYSGSKLPITKNKLAISDFVWWGTTWDGYHQISYSDKKVRPLFMALSHFMDDDVKMIGILDMIYKQLERGAQYFDIFEKYEITHDKVSSLKFFKNGKIEIIFADNTLAEEFKTEYLL